MSGQNNIDSFSTERLMAERLNYSNASLFVAMEADPEVMKTLGGIQPAEAVQAKIARNIAHWDQYGFGIWMFYDKAGHFVGRGGIRHLDLEGKDRIEIGYAIRPEFWGQGMATEITHKFIEIGRQLNLPELIAITLPNNLGSQRVMEKAGLKYCRECIHCGMTHVLYTLSLNS